MKRVLVLAYYFPPLGGAGVQRTVKLLKHLPSLGYEATVVTGPGTAAAAETPPDGTLAREIPTGTVISRLTAPPPPEPGRWRRRTIRWLGRPSPFERWWVNEAAAAGMREAAGHLDLIYATMSPFETAEAADRIASATGIPWVADLRDPWALDEWTVYPTALHRRRDEARMGTLLSRADAVVMNTKEAEAAVLQRFPGLATRLFVVPNGWDKDDFAGTPPERRDGAFRIVYAGYSHVESGRRHRHTRLARRALGGSTPGLDVLCRSHVVLLEAIRRLQQEDPALAAHLELHVAGASAPPDDENPRVRYHGYLNHADAVALVRSADLLFLPMHDVRRGIRVRTVPGKTYEYLASGRPILAAVPDGDARDLLARLPNTTLCRPREVECMTKALRAAIVRGPVSTAPPDDALDYERRALASRLTSVFDRVVTTDAVPDARVASG